MGRRSMKTLSSRDAKYKFGQMIESALTEPVVVEKHGRAVVVVLSVKEYERLSGETVKARQKPEEG